MTDGGAPTSGEAPSCSPLAGRRALVVGASRGIGRAVAEHAWRAGCQVAIAARAGAALDEVAAGLGGDVVAIPTDVRDPDDCEAVIDRAVRALGGLDVLVHAAGVSPLAPVADADADTWRAVLETNVMGPALVLRHALGPLTAAGGHALFLSSTMVGRPWPALGPYAASRAALEELLRAVRREHPAVRVTTVVVGPTRTGFEQHWDPALATSMLARWRAEGYLVDGAESLRTDDVAAGVLAIVASPVRTDQVDLLPDVRAPGWVDRRPS